MAQNTLFRYTNDLSPFLSHLHSVYSISCPTFIVQQKRVSYFPFFHNNFLDMHKVDKIILITRIVALYIIVFLEMKYFFMTLHVVLKILETCLSSFRTKNISFIFISRIYHLYFRTKKE